SSAQVATLLPIAEELDATAGNTAAVALVRRVAAVAPALRARAVALYKQLIAMPETAIDARGRLLAQLRATHQGDLLLGALRQPGMPELPGEYAALAAASGDPFFVEVAAQRAAEARV